MSLPTVKVMKPDKARLYIYEKLQLRKLPTLRHIFTLLHQILS